MMSGFNAYDQALASVLSQAVTSGLPMTGSNSMQPTGAPQMSGGSGGYDRGTSAGVASVKTLSLFCQNLPYSVTQDEIHEYFPSSVNINILIGGDNRPMGTCIVYFASAEQCESAFNESRINPIQIQGRNIRVNLNNNERSAGGDKSTGGRPSFQGSGGSYNAGHSRGMGRKSYNEGKEYTGGRGNDNKICITVFNLPFTAKELEIQQKFHSASRVYLKKGPDGRSKGIAVVHFDHPSARDMALHEASSIEMNGRFLRAETGEQGGGGSGGGRKFGGQDRGGHDNGGYAGGRNYGEERGPPGGSFKDRGYGRRGGGPNEQLGGGHQPREAYGGGHQPREAYGGGYGQRNSNQYQPRGGGHDARTDRGDFRSQGGRGGRGGFGGGPGFGRGSPAGGGGFSRGGGRNDVDRNHRERSPQADDGRKPKYGMGSITSAIVRQLPSSGRPMSDSSSSDSE